MVIDVEHVHRIGHRQLAVAAHDEHVFVVRVRGLEAQVVAAQDHAAVGRLRVDDDDFVVDDGADAAACRELFDAQVTEQRAFVDACRAHDLDLAFLEGGRRFAFDQHFAGFVVLFPRHVVGHRLRARHGADDEQRRILAADVDGLADEAIDAALAGIKSQEQDRFFCEAEQAVHRLQVGRHGGGLGLRCRLAPLRHVGREPGFDAGAATRRGQGHDDRAGIGAAKGRTLLRGAHRRREQRRRCGQGIAVVHALPVAEERACHSRVFDQQRIVGLAGDAGRGPVGAAGEHRLRCARGVEVNDELVVADVGAVVEQAVLQARTECAAQACACWRVGNVPTAFARPRVGQDQVHARLVVEDQFFQLGIFQLIERQVEGAGALEQLVQQRQHIAGQVLAVRVLRVGKLLHQLVGLDDAVFVEHVRQPLRGQDAVGERAAKRRPARGDGDVLGGDRRAQVSERARLALVGPAFDLDHLARGIAQRLAVAASLGDQAQLMAVRGHRRPAGLQIADRADFVAHLDFVGPALHAVAALAQRQVAPAHLLHRPHPRVLRQPIGVALALEGDPGGALDAVLLAVGAFGDLARGVEINACDFKAQAAGNLAVALPGDVGHFVVGPSAGGRDLGHSMLPVARRGKHAACVARAALRQHCDSWGAFRAAGSPGRESGRP